MLLLKFTFNDSVAPAPPVFAASYAACAKINAELAVEYAEFAVVLANVSYPA